jgi:hypothetical protein
MGAKLKLKFLFNKFYDRDNLLMQLAVIIPVCKCSFHRKQEVGDFSKFAKNKNKLF